MPPPSLPSGSGTVGLGPRSGPRQVSTPRRQYHGALRPEHRPRFRRFCSERLLRIRTRFLVPRLYLALGLTHQATVHLFFSYLRVEYTMDKEYFLLI